VVNINGKPYTPQFVEDVFYQASTRGGRPVERLIAGKVTFKDTTSQIGTALTSIASEGSLISAASGGGGGRVLGGLAAIGAISSIISANVKPRADTRYWNNLPETIHAVTLNYPGLPDAITVELFDGAGKPVQSDKLVMNKWIDKNGNVLIWIKSRT
jgi:hypothetical protein